MTEPTSNPNSTRAALLWSVFLAASWTWCIGMFLPVLMVRDYGALGFLVFAIPNCIGAAAVGWLARPSPEWAARHAGALRAFSFVTMAFQAYFAGWMLSGFGPSTAMALAPMLLLVTIAAAWPSRDASARIIALGVYALSIIVLLRLQLGGGLNWTAPLLAGDDPTRTLLTGLLPIAPVVVFGFLACPWMDLTLLRARFATQGAQRRLAFTLGYLVLFPAMILLTFASRDIASLWGAYASLALATALALHVSAQLGLTIGLHGREVVPQQAGSFPIRRLVMVLAILGAFGALGVAAPSMPDRFDLSAGELAYRVFISFYGLVFPAYAWLCMVPTRDGRDGPTRKKVRVWSFAVGVAIPLYFVGYIQQVELLLIPGLLIVLGARLALPGGPGLPLRRDPQSA